MLRYLSFAITAIALTYAEVETAFAQSSIDERAAAIRARQNRKPQSNWYEEYQRERAAADRRAKAVQAAEAAEIREKYGTYLTRGNEAADTLYKILGDNLFIYRNNDAIVQIKDKSVKNIQIQESYSIKKNYDPANIANNGVTEHVSIGYAIILKGASNQFITREVYNGEWLDWRGFDRNRGDDGEWHLLAIEIDKRADGSVTVKYSPDLQVFYTGSINNQQSISDSIAELSDCDWNQKFNIHSCLSWPEVRDRAAEERARIEAQRRAELAVRAEAEAAERRREEFVRTSAQTAFDNGDYRQSLKLEARMSPSCYGGSPTYGSGQNSSCYKVARSLLYLGRTYREGRGVNRNYTTALAYLYLASTIHQPYKDEYDQLMGLFNDMGTRDPVRFREADAALNQLVRQCTASNFQSC